MNVGGNRRGDGGHCLDMLVGDRLVLLPDGGVGRHLVQVDPGFEGDQGKGGVDQRDHLLVGVHRSGPVDRPAQGSDHLLLQRRVGAGLAGGDEVGGGDGGQFGIVQVTEEAGGTQVELVAVVASDPAVGDLTQQTLHPAVLAPLR